MEVVCSEASCRVSSSEITSESQLGRLATVSTPKGVATYSSSSFLYLNKYMLRVCQTPGEFVRPQLEGRSMVDEAESSMPKSERLDPQKGVCEQRDHLVT